MIQRMGFISNTHSTKYIWPSILYIQSSQASMYNDDNGIVKCENKQIRSSGHLILRLIWLSSVDYVIYFSSTMRLLDCVQPKLTRFPENSSHFWKGTVWNVGNWRSVPFYCALWKWSLNLFRIFFHVSQEFIVCLPICWFCAIFIHLETKIA